jgi:hypothetical protein
MSLIKYLLNIQIWKWYSTVAKHLNANLIDILLEILSSFYMHNGHINICRPTFDLVINHWHVFISIKVHFQNLYTVLLVLHIFNTFWWNFKLYLLLFPSIGWEILTYVCVIFPYFCNTINSQKQNCHKHTYSEVYELKMNIITSQNLSFKQKLFYTSWKLYFLLFATLIGKKYISHIFTYACK